MRARRWREQEPCLERASSLPSFEELTDWNPKGIGQLHERGEAQVLFAPFDCAGERPGEAALVRKLFLGPLPLLSQRSHALAKLFSDNGCILHSPYDQATV
jgi:hypothetical protein